MHYIITYPAVAINTAASAATCRHLPKAAKLILTDTDYISSTYILLLRMGQCCGCRPTTLVTEDPDVTLYTKTGRGVVVTVFGPRPHHPGLLYVKNGRLYLETVYYNTLVCKCYNGRSWKLSKIKSVEVVDGPKTSDNHTSDCFCVQCDIRIFSH